MKKRDKAQYRSELTAQADDIMQAIDTLEAKILNQTFASGKATHDVDFAVKRVIDLEESLWRLKWLTYAMAIYVVLDIASSLIWH